MQLKVGTVTSTLVKDVYLASPPLVVAYALAGTMDIDLTKEPVGTTPNGQAIFEATHGTAPNLQAKTS